MNTRKIALLGVIFLILTLLASGGFMINQDIQIENTTDHFINDSLKELDALQEMQTSVLRVRSSSAEYAMLSFQVDISNVKQKDSVEEDMKIEKELIRTAKSDFERNMNIFVKTIKDEGDVDALEIQKMWREFNKADDELISSLDSRFSRNISYNLIENMEDSETELLGLLEDSIDNEIIEVTKQGRTIQKLNQDNMTITIVGITTLIIISISLTQYMLKKINKYKLQISELIDADSK